MINDQMAVALHNAGFQTIWDVAKSDWDPIAYAIMDYDNLKAPRPGKKRRTNRQPDKFQWKRARTISKAARGLFSGKVFTIEGDEVEMSYLARQQLMHTVDLLNGPKPPYEARPRRASAFGWYRFWSR
jgi:hypothetical protein